MGQDVKQYGTLSSIPVAGLGLTSPTSKICQVGHLI